MKKTIILLLPLLLVTVALTQPSEDLIPGPIVWEDHIRKGDQAFKMQRYETALLQYANAVDYAYSTRAEPQLFIAVNRMVYAYMEMDRYFSAADLVDGGGDDFGSPFDLPFYAWYLYGYDSESFYYDLNELVKCKKLYAEVYRKIGLNDKAEKLEQEIKELKAKQ